MKKQIIFSLILSVICFLNSNADENKHYGDTSEVYFMRLNNSFKYPEAIEVKNYQLKYRKDTSFNDLIILSELYKQTGQTDIAITLLKKALAKNQNRILVYCNLGTLYKLSADYSQASEIYRSLCTMDTGNYLFNKQLAEVLDKLELADSAIYYYIKALELNPKDKISLISLSNLLINTNRAREGIKYTDRYLRYDSLDIKVRGLSAYLYLLDKQFDEAIVRFSACFNQGDTGKFITKYLGFCYYELKDYEKSKEYFEKAFLIDSLDSETTYYLALSYGRSYYKKLGIDYLNKTLNLINPPASFISAIYKEMADYQIGLYNYKDGINSLLRAYEFNPKDDMIIYQVAYHYDSSLKNYDLALRYYNMFLSSNATTTLNSVVPGRSIKYRDIVEQRIKSIQEDKFWKGANNK